MRALEILKAIEEVFPMRSPRRGEGDGFLEVPAPGVTARRTAAAVIGAVPPPIIDSSIGDSG
jgi:hypothetical protein